MKLIISYIHIMTFKDSNNNKVKVTNIQLIKFIELANSSNRMEKEGAISIIIDDLINGKIQSAKLGLQSGLISYSKFEEHLENLDVKYSKMATRSFYKIKDFNQKYWA